MVAVPLAIRKLCMCEWAFPQVRNAVDRGEAAEERAGPPWGHAPGNDAGCGQAMRTPCGAMNSEIVYAARNGSGGSAAVNGGDVLIILRCPA